MAEEVAGSKTAATLAAAGTGLGHVFGALVGPRFLRGLSAGAGAFASSVSRAARQLFLQITGLVFLLIGFGLCSKAWHEYQAYSTSHGSPTHFYLAAFFSVLFVYFGLSSFWRARK